MVSDYRCVILLFSPEKAKEDVRKLHKSTGKAEGKWLHKTGFEDNGQD